VLFYLQSITPAFPGDPATVPPQIDYFVEIVRRLQSMSAGDLGERSVVTGDADRCITHLKKVEQAGIEEVILYL
jgi:hypothetical protein